jgi:hypothetical protein
MNFLQSKATCMQAQVISKKNLSKFYLQDSNIIEINILESKLHVNYTLVTQGVLLNLCNPARRKKQ